MYLGTICEIGPTAAVIDDPKHPYTQALISAVPVPDPRQGMAQTEIRDAVPTPIGPARGCPFADRCPRVMDICREVAPPKVAVAQDHVAACHLCGS